VNKLCSSALKATNYGATNIAYNHCDVVVSGGFESMSLIPYTIPAVEFFFFFFQSIMKLF